MKSKGKKTGFTIIELLTVMSIIIILIGMLVPSLNAVRRYARVVTQKGQFYTITKGLENYEKDENHKDLPDSLWEDLDREAYCGAMKLCEAMVGQDGLGFHPDSIFDDEGKAIDGITELYYNRIPIPPGAYSAAVEENLRKRELWIEGENVQIAYMNELFPNPAPFDANCAVICDVFKRNQLRRADGTKLGMPVLYYRADTSKLTHNVDFLLGQPDSGTNHYNYWDNSELVRIEPPWAPGTNHPLSQGTPKEPKEGVVFYENTLNKDITTTEIPYNKDGYILISAGNDGLYGTGDDVFNFVK